MNKEEMHRLAEAALHGLFDRGGISNQLEAVKYDDPETWNEILEETARNIEAHLHERAASQNLRASREREIDDLRKELQAERDKVTCRVCGGGGAITTRGPIHSSYSSCWKCNGAGRHAPGH